MFCFREEPDYILREAELVRAFQKNVLKLPELSFPGFKKVRQNASVFRRFLWICDIFW